MLFLFRSAPEVEKRIHSKLFRKFWRSRGTKEPAYITVELFEVLFRGVPAAHFTIHQNHKYIVQYSFYRDRDTKSDLVN